MLVQLDLRTLFFANGLLVLSSSACFVLAAFYLRQFAALPLWAMASALQGLALLLFAARGQIPDALSIVTANMLLIAGSAAIPFAAARDFRQDVRLTSLSMLSVAAIAIFLLGGFVTPHTALRTFTTSTAIGIFYYWSALLVWRYLKQPGAPSMAYSVLLPLLSAGGVLLCNGMLGLHTFLSPPTQAEPYAGAMLLSPHPIRLLVSTVSMLSMIGLTFGVILTLAVRLNIELVHQAHHDALTGLYNRHIFYELAAHKMPARPGAGRFSLLYLDLDYFKRINDDFGHAAGDYVLKTLADLLRRELRHHDVIARLGGEEFCVLLPDADLAQACQTAERLCSAVRDQPLTWAERPLRVTISIGVATHNSPQDSLESLISLADRALYQAKESGRDCYRQAHAGAPPEH